MFYPIQGNVEILCLYSYFLVDSKKMKLDKTLKILLDSMIISIIVLLCVIVAGYSFSLTNIVKQIFPDFFSNMWFIPIYVIFYLIDPLLNMIIDNLKNTLFNMLLFFV